MICKQEARLELELKEERLAAATRELEERGGGGDEVTALRRTKTELERRVRDQEEELDDLAGQIQVRKSQLNYVQFSMLCSTICTQNVTCTGDR